MKERYNELDLMKGIAIILVFLYHSLQLGKTSLIGVNFITKVIFINAYYFLMPLFFVISGFLSNNGRNYTFKKYYIGKIKRLLIPYLFINIIDYIPRTLFPNLVNSPFGGIREILFYGTRISWFVYTLLIIFMIFPLIEKFILKRDKYYLFGLLLFVVNYVGITNEIKLFSLDTVTYYSLYFYIGYVIKPFYKKYIYNGKITSNKRFIILSIVFLSLFYKCMLINFFTKVIFVLMSILFYLNIMKRIDKNGFIYKELEFFGVNSLTFYLLDGFAAVVFRTVLLKIIPEHTFLCVSLLFLLKTISIYIVIKYIILKSKILCFLFGAK